MKKMDPFEPAKKKKNGPKYQNFLEAFKDIGGSTLKGFGDAISGTAKNAVDVMTKGQSQSNQSGGGESFNFEEYLNQQENRVRNQERVRYESIRREEQIVFSRENQQTKVQIETIQTQIQAMAKDQAGLMVEIDKASFQAVVNPGAYHKNFFERLLYLIKLARKKISESRTWLQLHNHRAGCKSAYWNGVKKGGTSFMLSSDRTVATQAG